MLADAPSITALGWTPDGELSPEAEATQLLIRRIRQTVPRSHLTSAQINEQIRSKSREIAQLQDWYDSGKLSTPGERQHIKEAIDEVTGEIIELMMSVPAAENGV
mgnify:FL=1|tara:strand:- start:3626 stop:3940 length:315 start_codon:yes stop_codon:yes gene_type:complete